MSGTMLQLLLFFIYIFFFFLLSQSSNMIMIVALHVSNMFDFNLLHVYNNYRYSWLDGQKLYTKKYRLIVIWSLLKPYLGGMYGFLTLKGLSPVLKWNVLSVMLSRSRKFMKLLKAYLKHLKRSEVKAENYKQKN